MAKADFLKKRAKGFLEDARYDISKQKWFLAAFHLEQACQLYLKYYLFLKIADFPKTHSLEELLIDIGNAYGKQKELEKFKKENEQSIANLEQAYISSRYLPVKFTQTQVQNMEKFTKKLISYLKKL